MGDGAAGVDIGDGSFGRRPLWPPLVSFFGFTSRMRTRLLSFWVIWFVLLPMMLFDETHAGIELQRDY